MKIRFKNTNLTILTLGIYQIIGGLFGFGVLSYSLLNTETMNGPLLLIFFIVTGLYSLSVKSGILLIRKEYKVGLVYSIINQIVQVFAIGFGGYKFDFLSGAKMRMGFNFSDGFEFKFDIGITSTFNIGLNSSNKEYFFYFNLLAVIILLLLNDIYVEKFQRINKGDNNLELKIQENSNPE